MTTPIDVSAFVAAMARFDRAVSRMLSADLGEVSGASEAGDALAELLESDRDVRREYRTLSRTLSAVGAEVSAILARAPDATLASHGAPHASHASTGDHGQHAEPRHRPRGER